MAQRRPTRALRGPRGPVRLPRPPPLVRQVVPPNHVRARRGPRPPDAIARQLAAALAMDLREHGGPDTRWRAALAAAVLALAAWARRGVVAALPAGPQRELAAAAEALGYGDASDADLEELDHQVRTKLADSNPGDGFAAILAAVLAVISKELGQVHAAHVAHFARAAGSRGYVWTTQQDERVRQLHRELEGTRQLWSDPPVCGTDGFRGHPGDAGGCRCSPYPLL